MKETKVEKVEREIKQIGLDIVIGLIIFSLLFGFALGVISN
ncbi:MAG: hypothetical protein NTV95_02840 [Candidatus Saccharibacteria bacterium]|jgi:hypothetical protein|nr:hypothetical protein [Candidatus Saccharibacteria bacterium]